MKKKMKAQKLGLVLGMNMAVACIVLQGCKANKPGGELPSTEVTTIEQPAQQPEQQPVITEIETTTQAPSAPGGAGIRQETIPSTPAPTTRTVSKLPPPPKPAATKKPKATAAPAAAATVHVVKKGEVLSGISKKYNVKIASIVAANPGLKPDRIRAGQKLNIPGSAAAPKGDVILAAAPAPAGVTPAAANTTAPVKVKPSFKPYTGPTKEYVVKGGDSLGKIALASGITIRALKELNGLTKDNIRPGQKLKVPAEKVAKESKEVKDAKEVKTAVDKTPNAAEAKDVKDAKDVKEAKEANDAKDAKDVKAAAAPVTEPAANEQPAPVEPAPEPAPAPAGNTYTVKEGDDIVSISINWGISPSQLMNANDLKDNEPLKPGTVLKLPPNARQTVQ